MEIKYKRYEKYKNSGVEWLGQIPQHWNIKRLKNILQKKIDNRGRTPIFGDVGIPMLEVKNITEGSKNPTNVFEKFVLPKIVKRYERDKVKEGDLLISTVGATSGKVTIIDGNPQFFIAQNVIGLRVLEEYNRYFIYYLLNSEYFFISLKEINKGNTIDNLKVSIFINNICFIPPLQEQQRIADFLDEKTTLIDKSIKIKEKQIELLKERKQIVINNSVTKGLNKNVKLKDSRIDYIGEIPENWEIKKLKNLCKMIVSNVDKHSKNLEIPVKLCNYVDVYKNNFITENIQFMNATATKEEIYKYKINVNDLIITKDSEDWLDIGIPSLVKHEENNLLCAYHLAILRPNNKIESKFLHKALLDVYVRYQFSIKANGVTRYGISHGAILGTNIILPPLQEQKEIAEHLDKISEKIETAILLKNQEIEKLKEYKSTLINSAVTGKIKVF